MWRGGGGFVRERLIWHRVEFNGSDYEFFGVLVYSVGGVVGGEEGYKSRYVDWKRGCWEVADRTQILGLEWPWCWEGLVCVCRASRSVYKKLYTRNAI